MSEEVSAPEQEALLRAIAEKRKTDPLIGAKVGAKQVFTRLTQAMKTEKGVQVESLLCALGALAGYACQLSARASHKVQRVDTADGNRYFFGDALNGPLVEDKYSVWSIAAATAQTPGSKPLPDVTDIFRHVAATLGGSEFGVPRTFEGSKPGDLPINYLKSFWPALVPPVRAYCVSPAELPVLFALAALEAIKAGKSIIDPSDAARLVMECAVPMSKVDLDSHFQAGDNANGAPSIAQHPRPAPASERVMRRVAPELPAAAPVDDMDDDDDQSRGYPAIEWIAAAAIVAMAMYGYFFANFVPSQNWKVVSFVVGLVVTCFATAFFFKRVYGQHARSGSSAPRGKWWLVATFFAIWLLAYLGNNHVVGDLVTRAIGQPVTISATARSLRPRGRLRALERLFGCSARLMGPNLGRGTCISSEQYKQLPQFVNVAVQTRRAWMGYTVDDMVIVNSSR